MRDQLIQYVNLLFAGTDDADDIRQEILQNTLDRYDDLVSEGKSPEAAYRLAISGIGDINEILGSEPASAQTTPQTGTGAQAPRSSDTPVWKKVLRAIAVCLYIISIIPLIVLSEFGMEIIGLCGTLAIVAVATALIIISSGGGKAADSKEESPENLTPRQSMQKAVKTTITTVGLVLYFVISFATGAWHITWLIFPIIAAVRGLINAYLDLKEANQHEV